MMSRARVLSKLGAETHWILWKNLCFSGISSKRRGSQKIEENEIYCSCNFLFYGPNLRICMKKVRRAIYPTENTII